MSTRYDRVSSGVPLCVPYSVVQSCNPPTRELQLGGAWSEVQSRRLGGGALPLLEIPGYTFCPATEAKGAGHLVSC